MKVAIQLENGATLEMDHAGLSQLANALYKATAINVAQEALLRECHHELTTHHGLYAHDGTPGETWQLDCAALLTRLGAVLPVAKATP